MTKGGQAFGMLAKTEFCTVASSKRKNVIGKVINNVDVDVVSGSGMSFSGSRILDPGS